MYNIKIKKLLLIICSILIVSTGVIGLTLSVFTSSDQVVNNFEVGDVNIENKENFTEKEYPDGSDITKTVTIKNITTKTPALVRVNITPRWVEKQSDGTEIPWSGDASSNVVKLTFENIIPYTNNLDGNTFNPNQWMDGNDGYYYYTSILPADDLTTKDIKENETSTILKSVNIDLTKVENREEYYGKILIVDVNSEAVQPTQQAYIDAWGKKTHPQITNILHPHIKTMLNKLLGV